MVATEVKSEAVRDLRSQQTPEISEELQSCWRNQFQMVVGSRSVGPSGSGTHTQQVLDQRRPSDPFMARSQITQTGNK